MTQISRQRAYQLRNIAKGRCSQCGRERESDGLRCDACVVKGKEAYRRYRQKKKAEASA